VKIARNAIFDPKKADVHNATNIPGQKVSQGSYSAFVPALLPPELNWTPRTHGVTGLGIAREFFEKWDPTAANNRINVFLFECAHDVEQFKQNRFFASGRKIFRDMNFTGHLFSKAQSVLNQQFRLFLASAPVQGEVNIELYRMHARESVRQFPGLVENSAGVRVVGIRRRHEEHVGPFSHSLQLQIVSQLFQGSVAPASGPSRWTPNPRLGLRNRHSRRPR
jgi:hypothetical protein